jgi:drug/metabolite transporter (DMT)-like permease
MTFRGGVVTTHDHRVVAGIRLGSGEQALLVAAALYGVSTAVSVVALRQVRPADLLAIELLGAAAVLLLAAAWTGRLRRRAALRQMLTGALAPGLAYLFGAGDGDAGDDSRLGNLLVLAAAAVAAVYLIAARHLSDDNDGLNASAWQATGGALTTVPFMVTSWAHDGSRLGMAGPAAWAACVAVLFCGALADVAFNRGIGRVPAARTGQLAYLTPVVGTLTAVVVLDDRPAPLQLAGGVAILASLALLRDTASAGTAIDEKG